MEKQNTAWIVESQRLPMASNFVCAAPLTQHGTIVAVDGHDLCHIYSPRQRRWQALPPMKEKRAGCGVVPLGDEIVVLGGFRGLSCLSLVERVKLDDEGQPLGSWEAAPEMTQTRALCAAVVAEGKIVVVGGKDFQSDSHLSSAEMFDPLKNTWKRLPDMATKRSGCAAVAIGDKIFVFGGWDGNSYLNSAECLCINTKKWHSLPPMRKRRNRPAAVAIGGRILVVGGKDGTGNLCDVEVLDTSTMRWEEDHDVPSLNTGRCYHGATTVGNRIYVVGGEDNNGNDLDTMEILEVQEASNPSQPDYSEFETRIDLEAEVATLRKQIQDSIDSFELDAMTLAAQAEERLPRLEELLKTMPTAQKLRSDISDLEKRIRGLRHRNRTKDAIPLARKRVELVEQLRKEEMAEGQKTLPRPLSDKPR